LGFPKHAIPIALMISKLLASLLLVAVSSSAHAFWDSMVVGMTSVANNMIDSSESVTKNSIDASTLTVVTLSSDSLKMADRIGLMADRIGVMADRIGFMADRIVTTEGLLAGIVHKSLDQDKGVAAPQANYSSSAMLFGGPGNTYTATTPATQGYQPASNALLPQTDAPQPVAKP